MTLLTIRLFGELKAVDHRGDALSVGSRRTQAAIVWLALHLDSEAPLRDFEALFGEDAAMLARALQYAFRFLPTRLLEGDGPMLRLNAAAVDGDALRLQELDANGSIPALREAAELYSGNLLEGFVSSLEGYDDGLAAERLRSWRTGVAVLGKLLAAQIRAG